MTYDLYIGDALFSSWSLRGWLMLEKFNLPYRSVFVGLYSGTMADDLAHLPLARTVPVLKTPQDAVLTDSLAMAETLAEQHPDAGLYPNDPIARGVCRSMVSEMHSGFSALRTNCPMQLSHQWQGFEASAAVRQDLARIEALWAAARSHAQSDGPWLFGNYTLADVFYAPVAARIAGYDLPVSDAARAYISQVLADPAFVTWREMGLEKTYEPFPYDLPLERAPWPGAD